MKRQLCDPNAAPEMTLPDEITEPARRVPVAWQGDLCVVGGSCTGVFAAVRAARLGLSVALIEQTILLGGSATAAQVNEWHSTLDTSGQGQIIGGLTQEIMAALRRRGAVREIVPAGRAQFRFNSAELAGELDDLVRRHRIRVFLGARCVAAAREGDAVRAAVVEDKSGRRAVRAGMFIDASGDGDLLRHARFAVYQRPALQPVNMQALVAGLHPLDEREIWEAVKPLAEAHGYPLAASSPWFFDYPGGGDHLRNVFGPRLSGVDASDADALTDAILEGRRMQRALLDMIHARFGQRAQIIAWPHALGVRETWHARCRHQITGAELLGGQTFPDAIAQGTYPVDIHHPEGTTLRYLDGREEIVTAAGGKAWRRWRDESEPTPACYFVPFRSLVPVEAKNLLVAGRLLDADRESFGALRVMVNCNQMGEAAGVAAVLALQQSVPVSEVDPVALRAELAAGGSVVV